MQRLRLTNHQGHIVTPDTQAAIRALEKRAFGMGKWKLIFGAATCKGTNSLAPAGRELRLRLHRSDKSHQEALNALWACAIPLGFTPNDRWPRPSETDAVFYFLGPWQALNDRLLAEGRGHLAWPSVCIAAQIDVGVWSGDKETERFIQAQFHRIGMNVGPLDGVIGTRTAAAIAALGLDRPTLAKAQVYLQTAEPRTTPPRSTKQAVRGHLTVPGHVVRVQAFGAVKAQQHGQAGAFLTANGKGRFVVEVEPA